MTDARTLLFLLTLVAWPVAGTAEQVIEVVVDAELPFKVVSRADEFEFFPCNECHEDMEPDPTPRELTEAPHFPELQHGEADIWCTTCHSLDKREYLRTLSGKLVEFDMAYLVCAQCHNPAYEDWRYGAHGKRVKQWRGGRQVFNCTSCHNPHMDPGIEARKPKPPPGVRAGLQRRERARHRGHRFWQTETPDEQGSTDAEQ